MALGACFFSSVMKVFVIYSWRPAIQAFKSGLTYSIGYRANGKVGILKGTKEQFDYKDRGQQEQRTMTRRNKVLQGMRTNRGRGPL
jgi:hypothetical protein